MQQTTLTKPTYRSADALRGFAVLAIILVHNLNISFFRFIPDPASQPEWLNIRRRRIQHHLPSFAGKPMLTFSCYSVSRPYIQYTNQLRKERLDTVSPRLLLLAGFKRH